MTMDTGQVLINSSSPTLIVSAKSRNVAALVHAGGSDVYLGGASVTPSTGALLTGTKGTPFTWTQTEELYGITSTGTATVTFAEGY